MERLTEFHNGIWGMSVQAVKEKSLICLDSEK